MPVLIPITASPPHQKLLIVEQRRSRAPQPRAPLGMDNHILCRHLKIPAHNQIPNQSQEQLTSPRLTKRLHLRSKPKSNQRHIRRIRHIDLINPLLVIGRHIQIPIPHTAPALPLRITPAHIPLPHSHQPGIGKRPLPLRHRIIRLGNPHPKHPRAPGRIALIGKPVPIPVLPVQKLPIQRITPQKQKCLHRNRMVLQHPVRRIIQPLIQPHTENRQPHLPHPHTGILKTNRIQQIPLKIHLHCFKQHNLPRLPQIPDIQLLDLQKCAAIPHQAPVPVLPALGAGQRHRRNRPVPLARRKLPHKLIPILQNLALRLVQTPPGRIRRSIHIIGSISHRQIVRQLINMPRILLQRLGKKQNPPYHIRADRQQNIIPRQHIRQPFLRIKHPHGVHPQNIIHRLRHHIFLRDRLHLPRGPIRQFQNHCPFQFHTRPLLPNQSQKASQKPRSIPSPYCPHNSFAPAPWSQSPYPRQTPSSPGRRPKQTAS